MMRRLRGHPGDGMEAMLGMKKYTISATTFE
jgi:hypothetical protein